MHIFIMFFYYFSSTFIAGFGGTEGTDIHLITLHHDVFLYW